MFTAQASATTNSEFVGAGVYLNPSAPMRLSMILLAGDEQATIFTELGAAYPSPVPRINEAVEFSDRDCWHGRPRAY